MRTPGFAFKPQRLSAIAPVLSQHQRSSTYDCLTNNRNLSNPSTFRFQFKSSNLTLPRYLQWQNQQLTNQQPLAFIRSTVSHSKIHPAPPRLLPKYVHVQTRTNLTTFRKQSVDTLESQKLLRTKTPHISNTTPSLAPTALSTSCRNHPVSVQDMQHKVQDKQLIPKRWFCLQ